MYAGVSDARLYRLGCGAALIVGPALFLVDNLIHPKELERGSEAEQLAEIAANADRWQIAHLIGFASAIVLVAAALGLAHLVRRRSPTLGLVGGAAALLGIGTVMVGIEGAVPSNAYFIVSSAVFLLGGVDAGIAVVRLPDEPAAEPAPATGLAS